MTDDRYDPARAAHAGAFVLALIVFTLIDLALPTILNSSRSEMIVAFASGLVGGQLGLAAIWGVLGPQRLLIRWPLSLLVMVLLHGAFVVGMVVDDAASREAAYFARLALLLPAILLAAELPIWILKLAMGCRLAIVDDREFPLPAASRQFGLQHILGATTALAVVLGLAQVGLSSLSGPAGLPVSFWVSLGVACACCILWSALFTLPCLWAAFVAENRLASTVVMAVYVVVISVVAVAIISTFEPPPSFGYGVKIFSLAHGALVFAILGCLHIVRAIGYALLRPGRDFPSDVVEATDPLSPDPLSPDPLSPDEPHAPND